MRRPTVGQKLFVGVIAVFLVFASTFIVYQQAREKQFKIDALNIRLQDFNDRMADEIHDGVIATERGVQRLCAPAPCTGTESDPHPSVGRGNL